MCVGPQRNCAAATQRLVQQEIQRTQIRQLEALHGPFHQFAEVRLHAAGGHLADQIGVVALIEGDDADVARVALVAGARMGDAGERNFHEIIVALAGEKPILTYLSHRLQNVGMRPETIRTSIDLPRDLHRRLHELASRQGCSARQLILRGIERAVAEKSPRRKKRRLRLDPPIVPSTGKTFNLTNAQIYDLIKFP